MNILISIDEKFIRHAETMLVSLSHQTKENIDVYLMYNKISKKKLAKFKNKMEKQTTCKVNPILFSNDKIKDFPTTDGGKAFFGLEAYNRLFCQFYLPKSINRILYLDVDMIVSKDITELYNMDFEDNYYLSCRDYSVEDANRINIENEQYVNSGMILINLSKLRKETKLEEIINYIEENKDNLKYPDQDILNMLYINKIKRIDGKYNFLVKDNKLYKDNTNIYIHHYAGPKPWNKSSYKIEDKYVKPYYDVLKLMGKIQQLQFLKIQRSILKLMKKMKDKITKKGQNK